MPQWDVSIESWAPPDDRARNGRVIRQAPASSVFEVQIDAPAVQEAVTLAVGEWADGVSSGRLPDWEIVRVEARREAAIRRPLELLGVTEVATLLSVSRQRASELSRTPRFPAPVAVLASGPVWARADVADFLSSWPRKGGRPRRNHHDDTSG